LPKLANRQRRLVLDQVLTFLGLCKVRSWDRCCDFKNIFAKKFSEKIWVFDSKQS
jgi:hypothetical protein